ncbi:hypothetical protein NCAS_0A03320 [Naumovozyma castellii]|uniref:DASH complex subunit DAD2 n=1 Tax=Naumovozyma castellii TaxID=27288 RepID=G0V600_NAUCA|nr:hypothetical protein NCAS_0A03320 [Naumovozyma castellii CBS 4309]CCC66890.1 hypothetical protein NCAS_0A03320 [Naumovozyma castellii CBS 4309]
MSNQTDPQIYSKRQELEALKKITALTDTMKLQLGELSEQVQMMENNVDSVARVTAIWDSVMKSISQASLGLLQYAESDYEVGVWDESSQGKNRRLDNDEDSQLENENEKVLPLPETLVRITAGEEADNTPDINQDVAEEIREPSIEL